MMNKRGGRRYSKYGITKKIFDDYIEEHNNCCPICNKLLEKKIIDHDHSTGNFRGVICNKCNTILGMANDNIEILQNSINYLSKFII